MQKIITTPEFQRYIKSWYKTNGRHDLPWRKNLSPYSIWISEIMLQQTQVERVKHFYNDWMNVFPTIEMLANASLSQVLNQWKGLGYNNRAARIHEVAKHISRHNSEFPNNYNDLVKLPGIGKYTACAILSFVWDKRVIMIETNIRRVMIHHFFSNGEDIDDKEILKKIEETTPRKNSRLWYWALMDYGSSLNTNLKKNPNQLSKHYIKQSNFKGSNRELRSLVLRECMKEPKTVIQLKAITKIHPKQKDIALVINSLIKDGLLVKKGSEIKVP